MAKGVEVNRGQMSLMILVFLFSLFFFFSLEVTSVFMLWLYCLGMGFSKS